MKAFLTLLGLFAWATIVLADEAAFRSITQQYNAQLKKQLSNNTYGYGTNGCNSGNVVVRRDWDALTRKEKLNYIRAVKCLMRKPSKSPPKLVPGARSRYDDFVAVHIYQTFDIHFNAVFLAWHRYYIWQYEKALRDECGYQGYQPYWEWSRYSDNPEKTPLFDGSAYSMSGDGESVPHGEISFTLPRTNTTASIPPGSGGGCIYNGPFKDMKVNLGPTRYVTLFGPAVGSGSGLDYNPRCLNRDLNPEISRKGLHYDNVVDLLTKTDNYADLTRNMGGAHGVHPSGHETVGGLMDEPFSSAGDPSFFLHHAQVDRIWAIWQSLNQPVRQSQLLGTTTWFNIPPSPNITSDFPIGLAWEAPEKRAVELTNTVSNDFCYIYE